MIKILKITIKTLLLASLLCTTAINPTAKSSSIDFKKTQKTIQRFVISTAIPIAISALYFYLASTPRVKLALKQQLKPKNLLKNFVQEIIFNLIAKIGHEFGHALTAKFLNNIPIQVQIGHPTDFKIWDTDFLKVNGLYLKDAYSKIEVNKTKLKDSLKEKIKYGLIYSNGGLSGALSMLALKGILNKKNIHTDPIILQNILNILIPLTKDNDASKIYNNCFNVPEKITQKISSLYLSFYFLMEFYLANKQARYLEADVLDKFFITIINLCTKYFFRFHV